EVGRQEGRASDGRGGRAHHQDDAGADSDDAPRRRRQGRRYGDAAADDGRLPEVHRPDGEPASGLAQRLFQRLVTDAITARMRVTSRSAHSNSRDSTAMPARITTTPGPGRTSNAMPTRSSIPPTIATTTRRTTGCWRLCSA